MHSIELEVLEKCPAEQWMHEICAVFGIVPAKQEIHEVAPLIFE